ncbi:hypothetical protein IAD21_02202 [Abditibacteriota bacterium]|nr:hypothetical protein IAD21_02202 [Abditibacteriota bacterium]
MPKVTSKVLINAPFETVWALAHNVEEFPRIMPDLDKVLVLEKNEVTPQNTRVVTEWHGKIRQFNRSIVWTEEDIWNREKGECHFWQLKGDFTEYKGVWKFSSQGDATELDLEVNYSFEIPLIGALMKSVLQKLMQSNADMMSGALKAEGERLARG